ncbi:hypothetical protein C8R44DRAFT_895667 [Mycena epipterygia]|nr:hypothetical protein C8R44DRAFT_895667 [Mycena epipterygia]
MAKKDDAYVMPLCLLPSLRPRPAPFPPRFPITTAAGARIIPRGMGLIRVLTASNEGGTKRNVPSSRDDEGRERAHPHLCTAHLPRLGGPVLPPRFLLIRACLPELRPITTTATRTTVTSVISALRRRHDDEHSATPTACSSVLPLPSGDTGGHDEDTTSLAGP